VFGFLAGWLVDKFGPRRLMMAGILMAGVALVGLGSISTLGMFYFFYLINALGYVCGGPLPNQVLLTRWFDKSRGKAMGIAYLGIGLGGAAVPWISHLLVQHFGWQAALKILGIIIVVIAFPMAFFVKESPDAVAQREIVRTRTPQKVLSGAFKTPAFYLVALGSMCSIAAVSGIQQNLKLFLSLDRHYTQGETTRVISLILTCSIIGRLLMGWLADLMPKKYVMLIIYVLVAAAIPFLFAGGGLHTLYIFAFIFGVALGGDYMIIPLMTAEIFSMEILGRLLGVILTADGVAEAVSPWWVSHLRDSTGTYTTGFVMLIGIALLGATAVVMLPRRRVTE
jgi:sugar phosphate permease